MHRNCASNSPGSGTTGRSPKDSLGNNLWTNKQTKKPGQSQRESKQNGQKVSYALPQLSVSTFAMKQRNVFQHDLFSYFRYFVRGLGSQLTIRRVDFGKCICYRANQIQVRAWLMLRSICKTTIEAAGFFLPNAISHKNVHGSGSHPLLHALLLGIPLSSSSIVISPQAITRDNSQQQFNFDLHLLAITT